MAHYLYSELSTLIASYRNMLDKDNSEWAGKHEDRIRHFVKNYMPHGSGFDNGTKIDLDESHAEKLVFYTAFHHLNEGGFYDGWTEHTVIVTPSFSTPGFHLRISGRNRREIKDVIHDSFSHSLSKNVEWDNVQNWDAAKRHGVEIRTEWLDQSRMRWFVVADGVEVFTPETNPKFYQGSPIELCEAKAVEIVKEFFYGNK